MTSQKYIETIAIPIAGVTTMVGFLSYAQSYDTFLLFILLALFAVLPAILSGFIITRQQ